MEDMGYKISQLIDNELEDSEQTELFNSLASDRNARQIFTEFMEIKKEIGTYYSGKNADLSPSFAKPPIPVNKIINVYKTGFYFSIAASLVLAMLLFFSQANNKDLNSKIDILNTNFNNRGVEIKNITPAFITKSTIKEEIAKPYPHAKSHNPTMAANNNLIIYEAKEMIKEQIAKEQFAQNKIVVTKNDFIGGKIVAN